MNEEIDTRRFVVTGHWGGKLIYRPKTVKEIMNENARPTEKEKIGKALDFFGGLINKKHLL